MNGLFVLLLMRHTVCQNGKSICHNRLHGCMMSIYYKGRPYIFLCRSDSFRPVYARLHELRALVPSGVPLIAATATVTKCIREDVIQKLDMNGCQMVFVSPNRLNMYYEVRSRTNIETDMEHLVTCLKTKGKMADRVIVYCRSLNMCADLYEYFHSSLGSSSYYPSGAKHVSDNRLFGMFHSNTSSHNKDVIMTSMQDENGIVRVVFATIALGMGVNFKGLNTIYHYGAPRSIDDFFQESGRAGRREDSVATSIVYWKPSDAPLKRIFISHRDEEVAAVRRYLENCVTCRRVQLMNYFDPIFVQMLSKCEGYSSCCDVCTATLSIH